MGGDTIVVAVGVSPVRAVRRDGGHCLSWAWEATLPIGYASDAIQRRWERYAPSHARSLKDL